MLVSEDYPWGKLLREYATYCAVGCINVAVFFLLYYLIFFNAGCQIRQNVWIMF